ncbi:hypothetical protein Glove_18g51 [Diversispora epigaea]|uniref:Uncharacterized protein n=1 Tax=Diversispora epigaea TaxID=1348612 RepID=A0A397JWD1_9GLOM|nr:hypothetical protein Glove_18g51 [Diversispora epigaea]
MDFNSVDYDSFSSGTNYAKWSVADCPEFLAKNYTFLTFEERNIMVEFKHRLHLTSTHCLLTAFQSSVNNLTMASTTEKGFDNVEETELYEEINDYSSYSSNGKVLCEISNLKIRCRLCFSEYYASDKKDNSRSSRASIVIQNNETLLPSIKRYDDKLYVSDGGAWYLCPFPA